MKTKPEILQRIEYFSFFFTILLIDQGRVGQIEKMGHFCTIFEIEFLSLK